MATALAPDEFDQRAAQLGSIPAAGMRLEMAAATLTGFAERGDAAQVEQALETYRLEKEEFRLTLESRTEVTPDLLLRWLTL